MADYKEPIIIRYEEAIDSPWFADVEPKPADKAKSDRLIERYQKYMASTPTKERAAEATLSLVRKLIKLGWCWTGFEPTVIDGQLMNTATLAVTGEVKWQL